jgi:hypothetical protein
MRKFQSLLILIVGCLSSLLAAADPTIWISLKPSEGESIWLIYREEKLSDFYKPANGTIIPMAVYKVGSMKAPYWGISPLLRKDSQIEFDIIFKNGAAKEWKINHNFFSKGNDRKLAPLVVTSEDCFEIQIPEEDGQTRKIKIQKETGIENLKIKYKVSPLMPIFKWNNVITFEI